jgi:hypothetical protein
VEASAATIASLRQQFFHASPQVKKQNQTRKTAVKHDAGAGARAAKAPLVNALRTGQNLVARTVASHRLGFRLYFPAKLTPEGRYASVVRDGTVVDPTPRVYTLRDRAGHPHHAYRLVVMQSLLEGSYYGIEGTDWRNPPLLAHPTSTTTVGGKRLLLFKAGSRLRYVGYKRKDAVYWVSNSLNLSVSNAQMISIAGSLTHLGP